MKLKLFLSIAALTAKIVHCEEPIDDDLIVDTEEEAAIEEALQPVLDKKDDSNDFFNIGEGIKLNEETERQQKPVNFSIDYSIFGDVKGDGVNVPFLIENNELTYINYTFHNYEEFNASILGIAGSIVKAETQETVGNITEARLGPLLVQSGQNISFSQSINIALEEGYYYIAPVIQVIMGDNETPVGVSVQPKVFDMLPGPVSFFNASFLSILLTCGLLSYSTYRTYKKTSRNDGAEKKKLKKLAKNAKINADDWTPKEYKK
ncbi:uncharacterized protein HGUI_00562 [Hanseniaspora guilliermondii]|uniref:Increased recombination centers protein 22 n=1 Tax=Hanseniaspora guilliermondii TaxID=56406 RepID=A0A1L0AV48_9ASCO|nr:uncharacterized protein HGUI_00562 [Hanseniaspora guilliermondii]